MNGAVLERHEVCVNDKLTCPSHFFTATAPLFSLGLHRFKVEPHPDWLTLGLPVTAGVLYFACRGTTE